MVQAPKRQAVKFFVSLSILLIYSNLQTAAHVLFTNGNYMEQEQLCSNFLYLLLTTPLTTVSTITQFPPKNNLIQQVPK